MKLTKHEQLKIIQDLNIGGYDAGESYKFNCRWHDDKNPSMSLLYTTNIAKCFSCGATKHINSIIKEVTGESAYQYLGTNSNYHNNNFSFTRHLNKSSKEVDYTKKKIHNIKGDFVKIVEGSEAYEYLVNTRKISKEFIEHFELTYTKFAEINRNEKGETEQEQKGTFFVRRICTPIYLDGKLVNIDGRAIDTDNTPKVLYSKRALKPLFNFDNLKKNELVYVTEGLIDVGGVWDHVSKNVTSTLGAHLSPFQKEQLNQLDQICLLNNNDDAGKKMISDIDEFYDGDMYTVEFKDMYNDINNMIMSGDLNSLHELINGRQLYIEKLLKDYELF